MRPTLSAFSALLASLALSGSVLAAETTLDLSGAVPDDQDRHFFVPFDVPAGTVEIQIHHDDLSDANILDWGLVDETGAFRGWGGGNTEDATVGEQAATRSYLPGPIHAGTWKVVVGKAKIKETPATFALMVTLRDAATLPPDADRAPYQPTPALSTTARWYSGDFHVHSRESGDAEPTLEAIAAFAKSRGLDFVEYSDHNTNSQLEFFASVQKNHADLLMIPGVEFTTYWGHANGIGATEYVDDKTELAGNSIGQAVQAFHAQGALFSINHPTLDLGDACIGCAWTQNLAPEQVDAVEVGTGKFGILTDSAVGFWDEMLATGRHLPALGGSDDHKAGVNENATQSPIASPTTLVFATELSVSGIMDGIRAGRTVVKLQGPDDPMIELESSVAPTGDTVTTRRTHLSAKISGGSGYSAHFVKNGVPEEDVEVTADLFVLEKDVAAPASGEDRWRVEALNAEGRLRTVTSHLFIVSDGSSADESDSGGCGCRTRPGGGRGSLALGLIGLALLIARSGRGLERRR
jgi:hypothetical protein